MKTIQKLSLLAMALALVSCNEKVSPELQQGNSSTTPGDGSGPTIIPEEYYFKLTNTAPAILNYKLHKTGAGNMSKACEIKSGSALSNDTFLGNPSAYDITCYLEAEELALNIGGMAFEIEASPNTCEAVGYSPFSYYNRRPGDSSGSYTVVNCTTDDTTDSHVSQISALHGINLSGAGATSAGCNQAISDVIDPLNRIVFNAPESAEELCRFKYEKENCDVGSINIRELQITYSIEDARAAGDAAGSAAGDAAVAALPPGSSEAVINATYAAAYGPAYAAAYAAHPPTYKYETKTHECGGSIVACIDGPIKSHDNLPYSSGTIYEITTFDETYKSNQEYPKLLPSRRNYKYANFRRNLANRNIAYDDGTFVQDPGQEWYIGSYPSSAYTGAWNDNFFGKIFDPNFMDRYSRNRLADNSAIAVPTTSLPDSVKYESNTYTAKPLAPDPFMGPPGNRTNPFYEWICYDTAWDIKSRIRLVVRDWDRLVPNNSDIEYLSDLFKGSSAKQDNVSLEYPYDVPFNDSPDWDDLIPMSRTAPLIYEPVYGYYSPFIFPNYNEPDSEPE